MSVLLQQQYKFLNMTVQYCHIHDGSYDFYDSVLFTIISFSTMLKSVIISVLVLSFL